MGGRQYGGRARSTAKLLAVIGLALVVGASGRSPAWPLAGVTLAGPEAVAVGDTIEIVASASPPGGVYGWLVTPRPGGRRGRRRPVGLPDARIAFDARGERLAVTGIAPSAGRRDVTVSVFYTVAGQTVSASKRLTVAGGDVTAHRPQVGVGYAPLGRLAVPEAAEDSVTLGPGIRANGAADSDASGEDDLIEVTLAAVPANVPLVLYRGGSQLAVWTTRDRSAGTELSFSGATTATLPFMGSPQLTVWVEWVGSAHGTEELELRAPGGAVAIDRLTFHTFQSIVCALGGEGQVPSDPVDPNHGTFLVGEHFYALGYDVHLHDEDDVDELGLGPVHDEVVTAIQDRGVSEVVLFGYSHGGGSTHDLAELLDANRGTIGAFSIPFTSFTDGVENDSDTDVDMELRHPPSSALHVNHYQHGTFIPDFFLDGGPVPNSVPGTTGLDVETTAWGSGATHFLVDDYTQVRDVIEGHLEQNVNR